MEIFFQEHGNFLPRAWKFSSRSMEIHTRLYQAVETIIIMKFKLNLY
jgi:hypothetical protein